MEDGMSEEDAFLAVEPPFSEADESEDEMDQNDLSCDETNHFYFKKCSILIEKLPLIERAMKLGLKSILLPTINHPQ